MRIGIDIGGTTISTGLFDDNIKLIDKEQIATKYENGYELTMQRICKLVDEMIAKNNCAGHVEHIGVGCAGMVDRKRVEIIYSNNIDWHNVPLGSILGQHFGVPIYADNDAICATIGEYVQGAGKKYDSMLMITLGTGIGGGIVLDNKMLKGYNEYANIIGHMVIQSSGLKCTCGRSGCFETYASATALIRMADEAAQEHPESLLSKYKLEHNQLNGLLIFKAISENDETAIEVFENYTDYLSIGISNLVNILNPQSIVIGGGLCNTGEQLLRPIREKVLSQIYCKEVAMPEIITANLYNDAGIIGAALLPDYMKQG